MITIATGVFTTIDFSDSLISQKYWVSLNYVGVGRFALAIGKDVTWALKKRKVKQIKAMYETIRRNTFQQEDKRIYERFGSDMDIEKFGLTVDQIEILYNLEYYVTFNDLSNTKKIIGTDSVMKLKLEWLHEWKHNMSKGFAEFVQMPNAQLRWYSVEELFEKIRVSRPNEPWFRLVLLEVMLFEPYFPLSLETDKKGNSIPSKKYDSLHNPLNKYSHSIAEKFLDALFPEDYYTKGYIKRLRKCHNKVIRELKEVMKAMITVIGIAAAITIAVVASAGMFAPKIAVLLVGSSFTGLHGAALTSACLAYLGGGAVAIGGAGMAGGTVAIVGGSAILGLSTGALAGGTVALVSTYGKHNIILQSAKLMVAMREVFLNDEHDIEFSDTIYEQYVSNIMEIEKGLVELKLQYDTAQAEDKKQLKAKIKEAEEMVEAMKIARMSMYNFNEAFKLGLNENIK